MINSFLALATNVAHNIPLTGSAVLVDFRRAFFVVVLGCALLSAVTAGANEQEGKVPKQVGRLTCFGPLRVRLFG